MLGLIEFIKQNIGNTPEEIINYFDSEISQVAEECGIDWGKTKYKITNDGERNSHPNVIGIEKKDRGRVYTWLTIKKSPIINQETYEYAIINFKNYRNEKNQIGKSINLKNKIFDLYNEYKINGNKFIKKNEQKSLSNKDELRIKNIIEQNKLIEAKNENIKKEEKKWLQITPLFNNKKVFSLYANTKKISNIIRNNDYDLKVSRDKNGYFLAASFYDENDQFAGLQRIYNNPLENGNNKKFSWGFNPMGKYKLIGVKNLNELKKHKRLYLCEGLATGITMHLATKEPVIICLISNNIEVISKLVTKISPNTQKIHVADNDKYSKETGNTGVTSCSKAVKMNGGWVFIPKPSKGVDVNDMLINDGLEALKNNIKDINNYINIEYCKNVVGKYNLIT